MPAKPLPTKPQVHYRPAPGCKRQCWNCAMYTAHKGGKGNCSLLQDQVRPGDVCDEWQSRAKGWSKAKTSL